MRDWGEGVRGGTGCSSRCREEVRAIVIGVVCVMVRVVSFSVTSRRCVLHLAGQVLDEHFPTLQISVRC